MYEAVSRLLYSSFRWGVVGVIMGRDTQRLITADLVPPLQPSSLRLTAPANGRLTKKCNFTNADRMDAVCIEQRKTERADISKPE